MRDEVRSGAPTSGGVTTARPADDDPRAAEAQATNSGAFWAATAGARGDRVVQRAEYVAVVGDARTGTRVLIQRSAAPERATDEIRALVDAAVGPVTVEDPFSSTDLDDLGLRTWQMPIMVRPAEDVSTPRPDPRRPLHHTARDAAERVIIEAFDLDSLLPHRPGEFLPDGLVRQPSVGVHLAEVDNIPAAAGISFVHAGVAGHYWVGTLASYRSRGLGGEVMRSSFATLRHLPCSLTASRLGRPLYESLGYVQRATSTWRSSTS